MTTRTTVSVPVLVSELLIGRLISPGQLEVNDIIMLRNIVAFMSLMGSSSLSCVYTKSAVLYIGVE